MLKTCCLFVTLALAVVPLGCDRPVQEERIEVKVSKDPLFLPRSILQKYADGQPLGSEVTSFPAMIEDVRKVDPTKAGLLENGLQEIQQASPASRASKAKELLDELQPSTS